jgi:prevent-host-death family protein
MMTVTLEDARTRLGELVNTVRLSGEPVTITRYGKPAVVLVPARPDDGLVTDPGEGGGS